MGGAFVEGNVFQKNLPPGRIHDGTAEWNMYYDAPAAAKVFQTKGLQIKYLAQIIS